MTKKYKIYIDRSKCIGCGTCIDILPKIFDINSDDGLVQMKNSKKEGNAWVLEINDSQLEEFQKIATSCPTTTIRISH
ncbi:MAG: hypothetical protein A2406_00155 [Candidatus Komeilibacteria bacterium RIFOXYC1_FULL_37_11]|uniref:Ferredoxin n=1 Tax=Candidatus Komeilibacteria bacterium RIFOXYC1_FULL_37_11 TaxID=1798555 RepID=A0A1G2BXZ7_9BACT|nr:MAG: hypothetical protein A2406_00155 [Candidatus Komeilibacteria bacterium RIFOXYC1_FULL_37_11]OGY95111.1 MAG: hypothetical protein A2611_00150 [Candidatus Komeilibacteria bacterium RIFOXYD1_FULL_37_29]OGY96111.1 MAG: hypothetical protein A2543_02725 [Candidatus Komeilibacteria bacterium RIFOXYD2_FULL_37_8]